MPQVGVRRLAWLLVVGGLVGFVAAFVLLVEKLRLLEDPTYIPSCSLNPVLSCGTIMKTGEAEVLGFPNPMMGIPAFAVVITTGVALLAGARLSRWYWLGLQAGCTAGIGFVGWLVFQSLYDIGALCPYCMVVWAVTIPLTYYVTLHNVQSGVLRAPDAVVRVMTDYQVLLVALVYLTIVGLALERFWYYWRTLI